MQDKSFYNIAIERGFHEDLSNSRFSRYLGWAGNDKAKALRLYALNVELSRSLFPVFHVLEIMLRNRIDETLCEAFGPKWYLKQDMIRIETQLDGFWRAVDRDIFNTETGKSTTRQAQAILNAERGNVIAAMDFGFWCGFFRKEYEGTLWRPVLRKAFPADIVLTRGKLNKMLQPIRRLRNRIAHHEPILYWDLRKYYDNSLTLIGWLSEFGGEWCRAHGDFDLVFESNAACLDRIRDYERQRKAENET